MQETWIQIKQPMLSYNSLPDYSLGENNGLFDEESNETQQVSILHYTICGCTTESFDFTILQVVADILSNVLDERNAPAFEATAKVTIVNYVLLPVSQDVQGMIVIHIRVLQVHIHTIQLVGTLDKSLYIIHAQKTTSAKTEDGRTATPATSILQSTERVTNLLAATVSKHDSFTISRPNLGTYNADSMKT